MQILYANSMLVKAPYSESPGDTSAGNVMGMDRRAKDVEAL